MTKKSNNYYILLSCPLLQEKDEVMAAKVDQISAVVNGSEKYETLQVSLKDVFREDNSFTELGFTTVDKQNVDLEFLLGGDYKFLLTVMGLRGATSLNACLWCIIHNDKRWETDKLVRYLLEHSKRVPYLCTLMYHSLYIILLSLSNPPLSL